MLRCCVLLIVCVCWTCALPRAILSTAQAQLRDAPSPETADLGTTNELIVRQWMEKSRRSQLWRADAIEALTRLARWKEVDQLLSSLNLKNIPAATQASMVQRIGPTVFLRIKQSESVSNQAKTNLDTLANSAKQELTSQAALDAAIKQITEESSGTDLQLAAARVLVRGGNASIVAITHWLVEDRSKSAREQMMRVLLSFGPDALMPLQQISLYGEPDNRLGALESLRLVNRKRFLPVWLTGLHARDATEEERNVSLAAIGRFAPSRVSFHSAVAYLENDLHHKREAMRLVQRKSSEYPTHDRSLLTHSVWMLGGDRTHIAQVCLTDFEQAYREMMDAASRLKRLGSLSRRNALAIFATEVGYQVVIDPDWLFDFTSNEAFEIAGKIEPHPAWKNTAESARNIQSLSEILNTESLESWCIHALAYAHQNQDDAATLGLIRFLSESARSDDSPEHRLLIRDRLLSLNSPSGDSGLPILMDLAASAPTMRIRFEAALLVANVAGNQPYAGRTRVKRTLAEMTRLTDRPILILVETRSSVRVDTERLAAEMGLQLECVPTVADLLRRIQRGGDLRVIVSKSNLKDQRPIELLDSVRRLPRGKRLPILFYPADQIELNMPFESRWDAPLVQLDGPVTRSAIADSMAAARHTPSIEPLTGLDRRLFRRTAMKYFTP